MRRRRGGGGSHCAQEIARVTRQTPPGFDSWIDIRDNVVVKSVEAPTSDVRTRDRVRALLLELGPSTAPTLGERTGLTIAGARRHLHSPRARGSGPPASAPISPRGWRRAPSPRVRGGCGGSSAAAPPASTPSPRPA